MVARQWWTGSVTGSSTWVAVLPLLVGSSGCVSLSAPLNRHVEHGALAAQLERAGARPAGETRLSLVLSRVPPGARLIGAALSESPVAFCNEGLAKSIGRDARAEGDPLRRGDRLTLEFADSALVTLSEPEAHLDLLLVSEAGTERCFRLPLGAGVQWSYDQRFTVGLDLSVERFVGESGPVSQIVTVPITLGAWVGATRFELGAGLGGAGCPEEHCDIDEKANTKINYSTFWPMHAGVQRALWEGGESSVGLAGRYRVMKLAADTRDEGRFSAWAHGPVIAPYYGLGPPVLGKIGVGGSRTGLLALEIPIGYVFGAGAENVVSLGVNLRVFATSF